MILIRKERGCCDVCCFLSHGATPSTRFVVMFPVPPPTPEDETVVVTLCREHAEEILKEFDR